MTMTIDDKRARAGLYRGTLIRPALLDRDRRRAPLRFRTEGLPRKEEGSRQPAGRCRSAAAKPTASWGAGAFRAPEEAPSSFRQNVTKTVKKADSVQLSWKPAGRGRSTTAKPTDPLVTNILNEAAWDPLRAAPLNHEVK